LLVSNGTREKKKSIVIDFSVNDTETELSPLERSTCNVQQYQYQRHYQHMTFGNLAQGQEQADSSGEQLRVQANKSLA